MCNLITSLGGGGGTGERCLVRQSFSPVPFNIVTNNSVVDPGVEARRLKQPRPPGCRCGKGQSKIWLAGRQNTDVSFPAAARRATSLPHLSSPGLSVCIFLFCFTPPPLKPSTDRTCLDRQPRGAGGPPGDPKDSLLIGKGAGDGEENKAGRHCFRRRGR